MRGSEYYNDALLSAQLSAAVNRSKLRHARNVEKQELYANNLMRAKNMEQAVYREQNEDGCEKEVINVDNVDNNVDKINVYTVEVECTSVYKVPVVAMSMHEACTKAVHELECNGIDDYPKTGEYEFQACSVRREGRG